MPSAAATGESSEEDTPAGVDAAVAVAGAVWLLGKSEARRQFRLFHKAGKPVAFASWTMVSDAVAEHLGLEGGEAADDDSAPGGARPAMRLKPEEWRCGERRVLVGVVTPFGGAEAVVQTLSRTNSNSSDR
jgi:hemolysin-activating ACP:hemolysin acyltransferase